MDNETKSKEIANLCKDCDGSNKKLMCKCCRSESVYHGAIEMAQWKDEQFSKFLLWLDDFYVIRKFDDGEPMTYGELIDAFKNMDK